jgi:hypothetical protein
MATQGSPQLLYHFLRIGLKPLLPADPASDLVAYVIGGIAVVLVLIGVFVLKPAVPARRAGQTSAEYWAAPKTVQKAMSVWFIVQGAGTLAAVGFLMTGHAVAAAAMILAIAVFWIVGPETFERNS